MASVCLKSYWARDSSQLFFSSRSMFGFLLPHAWFSVFSFHMPFLFYTESVHELLGFFEVRVIISCCIFISELLFGLCFNCQLFLAIIQQVFVLNKCVLWLQSRSCFTGNFWYLTLSSVYWNQGLNFAKFFTPWSCLLFTAVLPKRLYKTHTKTKTPYWCFDQFVT